MIMRKNSLKIVCLQSALWKNREHKICINNKSYMVIYKSRFGCWEINKNSESVRTEKLKNKINQTNKVCLAKLFFDALKQLNHDKNDKFSIILKSFKKSLLNINNLEDKLKPVQEKIQSELFDYYKEHYNLISTGNSLSNDAINKQYKKILLLIKTFEISKQKTNQTYQEIYNRQQAFFETNKLISAFKNRIKLNNFISRQETKDTNILCLLSNIFNLQKDNNYIKPDNNFKLQTLICTLADELKLKSTKGCKSNNNRGQRLMQKIIGFKLASHQLNNGIYDMSFFDKKYESDLLNFDKSHLAIQAEHHKANMGVGGGKYKLKKNDNFSDNGMWSLIAKWSKFYKMLPNTKPLFEPTSYNNKIIIIASTILSASICFITLSINNFVVFAGTTLISTIVTVLLLTNSINILYNYLENKQITKELKSLDEFDTLENPPPTLQILT